MMPAPASPLKPSWLGELRLHYGHSDRGTTLRQSYATAPLHMLRPFYPEGPEVCHSILLHNAGGIVGGDRLEYDICLDPGAKVLLTSASAGKVYKSQGQCAHQNTRIIVAAGACVEWLPQETIVFNAAQFCQSLRVDLEPGGLWMGWDLTRFGRTARGERFVEGDWRSLIEVWQAGQPLWIDRQWLPASEAIWSSPHGLAKQPVVGSFALLGVTVDLALIQSIRQAWMQQDKDREGITGILAEQQQTQVQSYLTPYQQLSQPDPSRNIEAGNQNGDNKNRMSQSQIGITRLQNGLLCRYRGHSTMEAKQRLQLAWAIVRRLYGQRPAYYPRVW
jgi:urease accessory protein